MSAVRRMLLRLPVARPHTGKHQRGGDAPEPRPATTLLGPPARQAWCLAPPPKRRQRVTGTIPADVTAEWKRAAAGLSPDCGGGCHAPLCDGRNCTCDCHKGNS